MFRAVAFALAMLAPVAAPAATLGTFTIDYDDFTQTGGAAAGTFTVLNGDDGPPETPLTDSFDISSLAGQIIDELVITVTYFAARTAFPSESWFLDVYGSDPNSLADDVSLVLDDPVPGGLDVSTITLTATNGTGLQDAFATALANLRVDFGFRENTGGIDTIRIYDAVLTVNGTAIVPLPAPILMLLMALGGLGLWRRRQMASAA